MPASKSISCVLLVAFLCACASSPWKPIVDTKGIDVAAYEQDLEECRAYTEEVQVGRQAATGAATGAAMGGVIGAVFGNGSTAARGAGVGATTGGVGGASRGMAEKRQVLRNCLSGRGYRILN